MDLEHVLEFEEALAIVAAKMHSIAPATETVTLLNAVGRVLAQEVRADRDQPPFDRATRDGFAVQAAVITSGAELKIVGQIRAGELWNGKPTLTQEAVQIMTGAPIPAGADCVLMVEHVAVRDGFIRLNQPRSLSAGENVVPRGSEARADDVVIVAGTRIGAAEIALAANCGCSTLTVFARPKVAIVATGDELVEVTDTPGAQQIRNSNSYALAALVALAGGEPQRLAIAPDTLEAIRESVERGANTDLLVFSGGVSMGEYDLVERVLQEFGAEFFFTGVKMQPGKPVVFGWLKHAERYFFGLPGNPISTQVTFHCFVEPLLRALSGEADAAPKWAQATLAEDVAAKAGLTRLLPARMEGVAVRVVGWQGSGDLAANARANCYAELLPGREHRAGEVIRVLLR